MNPLLRLDSLVRDFGSGDGTVRALDGVSLAFEPGTFTAVMGPSGSGKSTLLQSAAGLDRPTSGRRLPRRPRARRRSSERALARCGASGSASSSSPSTCSAALTAAQNVALPSRLAGRRLSRGAVREALAAVGLEDRAGHRPAQLSGGQQQRVAIARALVGEPEIVFADEPTGALDLRAGREVLALLRDTVDEGGRTLVMVTHDPSRRRLGRPRRVHGRRAARGRAARARPPSRSPSA